VKTVGGSSYRWPMSTMPAGPGPSRRTEVTRAAARARLFASAYAPGLGIAAVRFDGSLRWTCLALALAGLSQAPAVLYTSRKRREPLTMRFTTVEDAGAEVSGFLASYIVFFVTTTEPHVRDLIGYGIYLFVVLIVFIRSDLVRINPLLYVLGFRIGKVAVSGQRNSAPQYMIARTLPRPNEDVQAVSCAGVFIKLEGGSRGQS